MKTTMRVMVATWIAIATVARAQTPLYWDGNALASNNWATVASWDVSADGTGGNPGAAPGVGNTVVFNVSPLNSAIQAALTANVTIEGLVFSSSGTTFISTDAVANRRIVIGSAGLTINAGAGAVTLGTTTDIFRVPLSLRATTLGDTQTWANNSANLFSLNSQNTIITTNTLSAWIISGTGDMLMAGVISGSGTNIIKQGAGTLSLVAANTFAASTGVFTLAQGRLRVGNNTALSSARLVLNGGTLSVTGVTARTLANAYTLGGNVTLGHATDNGLLTLSGAGTLTGNRTLTIDSEVTLSGAIGGAFTLTKAGNAVLRLTGANTYSATQINAGALLIGSTGALPGWDTGGSYTVASGAALAVGNSVTDGNIDTILGTGNFAAGSSIGFDTAAGHRAYAVSLANTGAGALGLSKFGANTLTLSENNSYTGGTAVWGGVLMVGNGGTSGTIGSGNVLNNANVTFNRSDSALVVAGNISGSGSVTNIGTGTVTLSGNNTYAGSTVVTRGELAVTGILTSGASIYVGTTAVDLGSMTIAGDVSGVTMFLGNTVAGSTGLVRQTAGNVRLTTNLQIGQLGSTVDGPVSYGRYVMEGGTLTVNHLYAGVNSYTKGEFLLVDGVVTSSILSASRESATLFGIQGNYLQSGGTTVVATLHVARNENGTGILAISNGMFRADAWGGFATRYNTTGTVYMGQGALVTLAAFTSTAMSNGAQRFVIFDGGRLSPLASSTTYMTNMTSVTITDNGATIDTAGYNITLGANISNAAGHNGALIKAGAGSLSLAGANTFSGGVQLQNGTLELQSNTGMGSGGLTMSAGTILSGTETVTAGNNIVWLGAVELSALASKTLTLSGTIDGAGLPLTKTGAGTVVLSGANNLDGAVRVLGGTLGLAGAGTLAAATQIVVTNGSAFSIDNSAGNLGNRVADVTPVRLAGGSLVWTHNAAASTAYSETLGALTVESSGNRLIVARAATDGTSSLTFASLARVGRAPLLIDAPGVGADDRNRVFFTSAPATIGGILPTWILLTNAVSAGRLDLAEYNVGAGLRAPTYADSEANWTAGTVNARPTTPQALSATRTINTLVLDNGVNLAGQTADQMLRFDTANSAAIILQTGGSSTITSNGNNGVDLHFGNNTGIFHTIGDLLITRANETRSIRGTAGFVKTGAGTLILNTAGQANQATAVSNMLGRFAIEQGTLELQFTTSVGGTVLDLDGGSLTLRSDSSSVYRSQDVAATNTPLVLSQSGTVVVTRHSTGGTVTDTLGNITLAPNVTFSLHRGGDTLWNENIGYTLVGNNLQLLGNASIYIQTGVGTGNGSLTVTNLTGTADLVVSGNEIIRSDLRVTGVLTLGGNLFVGQGSSGAVMRAVSGYGGVAGNITADNGILASGVNFTRELGTGAGQVRFIGGISAGVSAGGTAAPAVFTLLQGGEVLPLVWGSQYFDPGSLRLNEDNAAALVTLVNAIDLNSGVGGSVTRTITVDANTAKIEGNLFDSGTGTAGLLKTGGNTLWLTGALSYGGPTRITGGYLRVASIDNLPAGNLNLNAGNSLSILETAGLITRPLGDGNGQIRLVVTASGTQNGRAGFSAVGGDLTVDIGGNGTGTGPALVWNSTYFDPDGTVATNSALYLSSAAADGVLYFKNSIDLNGTGEAGVSDRRFDVVGTARAVVMDGAIVNQGGTAIGFQKKGVGTLVLAANNTYDGNTFIQAGTLVVGNGGTTGTLGAGTSVTNLGALAFNRSNNYAVDQLIVGNGAVAQIGSGTLTLTADNTYTGPTFVSNGVVRVNGTYAGGGLITVTDGARLGGSGTVGDITIENGGRIAPGNSLGTLTAVNLTLEEGAILEWELSNVDNASDLLVLGGLIGSSAPYTFDFMSTGYFDGVAPTVYTLITFGSNPDGLSGSDFVVTNLGGSLTGDLAVNANDITLTVIPEPASLGTLGILAIAVILRRRLRR